MKNSIVSTKCCQPQGTAEISLFWVLLFLIELNEFESDHKLSSSNYRFLVGSQK